MNKILIVDDEPALAELIADFCENAEFQSRTVTESGKVLAAVLEWRPDLITLDLEMPGMDGVEVLKMLQSHPESAGIPVVIISIMARGAFERGLLKGARMVVEKPLKVQALVSQLLQLVSGSVSEPAPSFTPTEILISY